MKVGSPSVLKPLVFIAFLTLLATQHTWGQDLQPRRWTHLPVGVNFFATGYAYSDGNIFLDPALLIEDAEAEVHTTVLGYARAMNVAGKTARLDALIPYSRGRWNGLLDGEPASTRRGGFGDAHVRFSVNLLGSPAQELAEFATFQPKTIVGVALDVTVPVGEYYPERLINLGSNRWVAKPQIGVVHNWDKWAFEVTGSAWFFSENDNYFDNTELDQEPLYTLQSHLIYTFRPGLWASASLAAGTGARPIISNVRGKNDQENVLFAASVGFPIDRQQGIQLTFLKGSTREETGSDYETLILSYAYMWGRGL